LSKVERLSKVDREGILFVVSAPSGAGKTTLCRKLVDFFPEVRNSVSFTTRPCRPGEVDGVDYHFVGSDCFQKMVDAGAFAEWAQVHGNYYGTALKGLQQAAEDGVDILLDIDCQGAEQLKENWKSGVFIFILPPSMEILESRLRGRKTDSDDVILRRLQNARKEIAASAWYDYVIVNRDLDVAFEEFKAVFLAERNRIQRYRSPLIDLIGQ